jgi:hypothetical protein
MQEESYEAPTITVLGEVTDMTQHHKHGILFDFPAGAAAVIDLKLDLNVDVPGILDIHVS